ncbi:MAG: IPT/TIG domain, FG-GAP repeat-containing protein [Acidobacteria bacterium OLB17]|nr:MAG: IPT/TIG domain, FG-GAP repeat-containing protein [Acidobacteria bacterium OLB17]MCZ2391760.1 VCBS repeat-containing protein [Acidobacteriota bacterium]
MFSVSELFSSWRTVARTSALAVAFIAGVSLVGANSIYAQAITEDFADITTLPAAGWTQTNHSNPVGVTSWFQGNSTVFSSQAGAATAYIGANFNSTGGAGTISNWLFAPTRTLNNGDVFKFWTRTTTANPFPDRMQVRLSTNGSSTNIGTTENDVGDFSTLLLDINPTLGNNYPEVWTEYTLTISGLAGPTSGRIAFRYYVVDGGPSGNNSNYIGIDTFSYTPSGPAVSTQHVVDYNGDGKTDYAVVRNTGGGGNGQVTWYGCNATGASQACSGDMQTAFGIASDFFVSGDFDGDSKSDVAVWRPGAPTVAAFYIFESGTSTLRTDVFGQTGDNPTVVDDYTGDGKADVAVYRSGVAPGDQSFWFYRASSGPNTGNIVYVPWGVNGDYPAPGDFDGNGSADFVVQRGGGPQAVYWQYLNGPGTISTIYFGLPTDVIVPGDYDGDGKTDLAVVRGSSGAINWYVRKSSAPADSPFFGIWGLSATDFVSQGDYDGDGKTDLAIWRPNADFTQNYFYVRTSSSGALAQTEWGQNGDYPVANFNAH